MAITDRRGLPVNAADTPIAIGPSANLAIKAPCRVATTVTIVLSGLQTVDGVALAAGDRVLVKDQTDTKTNGLYNVATGNWTRTADSDSNLDYAGGLMVPVLLGSANARTLWQLTSIDPITLGTTHITFAVLASSPTTSG